MTEQQRRYIVHTDSIVSHHIEADSAEDARRTIEERGGEVTEVEEADPPYGMYKSELEWDEEKWMTWAAWIEEAIQTDAIRDWVSVWPDWQLRFYLEPEASISYEPGQQKAITFQSNKEEYIFTQLGDGHPPGVGELTFLSVESREHTFGPHDDPVTTTRVNCDFENTAEDKF